MHIVMTPTGLAFDVSAPDPLAVRLRDISRGLAHVPFDPGRLKRQVSMAEVALLATAYAQRGCNIDDPWLLTAVLLWPSPQAYLPLLDPFSTKLWSLQMDGAEKALRDAVNERAGVRRATAACSLFTAGCVMVVASELRRQLGHSSALLDSPFQSTAARPWTPDLRDGYPTPESAEQAFELRYAQLERARQDQASRPMNREASAC